MFCAVSAAQNYLVWLVNELYKHTTFSDALDTSPLIKSKNCTRSDSKEFSKKRSAFSIMQLLSTGFDKIPFPITKFQTALHEDSLHFDKRE